MTYFLDFDRTIFNTDVFKKTLDERLTFGELITQLKEVIKESFSPDRSDSKRRIFNRTIGTFLSNRRFMFAPQQVQQYLYPDVPIFLSKHGRESIVVTYGVRAFITAKVASALSDLPLENIVYTSRKKGRTIRKLCESQTGPHVFVDDMHFQLASVSEKCPEVKVIEMRRDKLAGDGRWPVIHSLDELHESV